MCSLKSAEARVITRFSSYKKPFEPIFLETGIITSLAANRIFTLEQLTKRTVQDLLQLNIGGGFTFNWLKLRQSIGCEGWIANTQQEINSIFLYKSVSYSGTIFKRKRFNLRVKVNWGIMNKDYFDSLYDMDYSTILEGFAKRMQTFPEQVRQIWNNKLAIAFLKRLYQSQNLWKVSKEFMIFSGRYALRQLSNMRKFVEQIDRINIYRFSGIISFRCTTYISMQVEGGVNIFLTLDQKLRAQIEAKQSFDVNYFTIIGVYLIVSFRFN